VETRCGSCSAWPRSVVELFLVSCVLFDVAGYSMSAETGI